ncbi:hypothetical protein [Vibrio harveyi]|uniref:hypothetical protein n=1 Tax=Vibrio harveyi TaxID=669 RepID=UPI00237FE9E0|nr:hypothetical protein [Vibrio harveyi]
MAIDYDKLKSQREADKRKRQEENQKLFGKTTPLTEEEKIALREEAEELGFFDNQTITDYVKSVASEKDIECEDVLIMFFIKEHYESKKSVNVAKKVKEFEDALNNIRREKTGFILPDITPDIIEHSLELIQKRPEEFYVKNINVLDDIKKYINL